MNKKQEIQLLSLVIILLFCSPLFSQGKQYNEKGKTYTIGYMKNIFYNVDINDVQAALKVWIDETLKLYDMSKNYCFVNKFYNDFDELNSSMENDNIAILSISTFDYLNNCYNTEMVPLLVPEIDGEVGVEYCFLVRKENHYKNLIDLKGKNLGLISTPVFIASSLWLDVLLSKNKLAPKTKFFNKIETAQKESQLILNLFFGNLDACIVTKTSLKLMKDLNPQIGEKLVSMQNSPSFVAGLICCPKKNQNKEIWDGFYNSLIKLHNLNVGRQIFTLVKIQKLVPIKDEYFKSFRSLLMDHKKIVD